MMFKVADRYKNEIKEHPSHPPYKLYREIFDTYYAIEIQQMYCYTDWQINVEGIPYTGDTYWDEQAAMSYNLRHASIAEMVDLVQNQYPFTFSKPDDIPYIYDVIERYIRMVVDIFNRERYSQDDFKTQEVLRNVMDDLESMADLANHLYSACSYYSGNKEVEAFRIRLGTLQERTIGRTLAGQGEEARRIERAKQVMDIKTYMSSHTREASRIWQRRSME